MIMFGEFLSWMDGSFDVILAAQVFFSLLKKNYVSEREKALFDAAQID